MHSSSNGISIRQSLFVTWTAEIEDQLDRKLLSHGKLIRIFLFLSLRFVRSNFFCCLGGPAYTYVEICEKCLVIEMKKVLFLLFAQKDCQTSFCLYVCCMQTVTEFACLYGKEVFRSVTFLMFGSVWLSSLAKTIFEGLPHSFVPQISLDNKILNQLFCNLELLDLRCKLVGLICLRNRRTGRTPKNES